MTWQQIGAAVSALFAWLGPWLERFAVFLAGRKAQQASDAQDALRKIELANRAAAGVDTMPDADIMLQLEQRRLYRVPRK